MSAEHDQARRIRRGLGALLLSAGGVYLLQLTYLRFNFGAFLLAALAVALGLGLLRKWSWARWMALGMCFLMFAVPFVLPLFFLEFRPLADTEAESKQYLMFCAFGAAFALLGNRGLGYFRSDLARQEFGTSPATPDAPPESSARVLYSAAVWIAVLASSGVFDGLIAAEKPKVEAPVPTTAAEPSRATVERADSVERRGSVNDQAVLSPGENLQGDLMLEPEWQAQLQTTLPDLEVRGLCMTGQNTVQAVVSNLGGRVNAAHPGWTFPPYELRYTDLMFHQVQPISWGKLPAPGRSGMITLDNTADPQERDSSHLDVETVIDPKHRIAESDENNNRKVFRIEYRYSGATNVPRCDDLRDGAALTRLDAPQ